MGLIAWRGYSCGRTSIGLFVRRKLYWLTYYAKPK
jgi:hypothetical protein